jgi:hypothetical protein
MPVRHEAHFEAIRGVATKARMDNNDNQQSMIFLESRFPPLRIML